MFPFSKNALSLTLGSVLLAQAAAGCGAAPETEAVPAAAGPDALGAEASQALSQHADQGGPERAPLLDVGERGAAPRELALPPGPALDARAAAATEAASGEAPKVATIGPLASFYTGTVAAGGQQHWKWNNAGSGVYKVGFSPTGASTTAPCQFQLVRSWDVQLHSGEREFHFTIQNTSSIACGATVLLASQAASATWSTGGVNPGETKGYTWNNANPLTAAHFANVAPTGSTATDSCEFEVTRSFYVRKLGGERELKLYVKNVGTIACVGNILLAANNSANSSWSTGTLSPGGSASWFWNNANPLNRVYVPGVLPLQAGCELEILPSSYRQQINPDGTSQRRYAIGVKNVGSGSCSGTFLLNYLDS